MTTHLVVPGQVIAEGEDFLRGHGTYVEKMENKERLVASVAGHVERVNKLVSVIPVAASLYHGNVGDLVVGRVVAVQATRWKVTLGDSHRAAALPLSGVHLPGGVQRVRTLQDSREMRLLFQEGDLVSAEVHNVHSDGTLVLHTRSLRYGKLENGCVVSVPPSLIARRKNHFWDHDNMTLLLGTNGCIWVQRALPQEEDAQLAEHQEQLKQQHATTPVLVDERLKIARIRNAIECLSRIHMMITPEHIEHVYNSSKGLGVADMLQPDNVILLTRDLRSGK